MADQSQYPQSFQGVRPQGSGQNAGYFPSGGPQFGPPGQGMPPVSKQFSGQPGGFMPPPLPGGSQPPPQPGSTFNGQGGGGPPPGQFGQNRFPGPGGPPPPRFNPQQQGGLSSNAGQLPQGPGGPPPRFGPPQGQGGPPPRFGPPSGQPQRFPPTSSVGPQGQLGPMSQGQMKGPPPQGGINTTAGQSGSPFGAPSNMNGPPMGVRPPTSQVGQGFYGQQMPPTSQNTGVPPPGPPSNLAGFGPPPTHPVSQGIGAPPVSRPPVSNYGSMGPPTLGPPTSQSMEGQPSPRGPTQLSNLSGKPPQGFGPPPPTSQGYGPPSNLPNTGPPPPRLGAPPTSLAGPPPPRLGAPPTSLSGAPPMSLSTSQLAAGPADGLAPPPPRYLQGRTTPNELPKPFHGQATYSHTIAYHPNSATPTPLGSEPPSEKSSRDSSPVPNQQYDVLEGQFVNTPGVPPSATPPPQEMKAGITGRRQYPQMVRQRRGGGEEL
ncbi:basic salivary proline-rich protein 4 [Lingula anatina]|uniref:Basic salivary proline-rich protein 4 n=1 Tax=Lingula anatina TaxID=7574 RepID=A0A1S3KH67_LINAN|nr:basic salivary proline-rich protein 4 [Lingula anatina]|eukprot:XP_013421973.1 basic salivary proline-rich protein 4 [Lingula anatina]